MGRVRSVWGPDPYLEPPFPYLQGRLPLNICLNIPSLFLPQPLATSIQLPLLTPPFRLRPSNPYPLASSLPKPRNVGLRAGGGVHR